MKEEAVLTVLKVVVGAMVGVLGTWVAFRGGRKARQQRASEQLRAAYAEWASALKRRAESAQSVIVARDRPGSHLDVYYATTGPPPEKQELAHAEVAFRAASADEDAAYLALSLAESDAAQIRRIEEARKIELDTLSASKQGSSDPDAFAAAWERQNKAVRELLGIARKRIAIRS